MAREKTGGRKAGTPNKATKEIKEMFVNVLHENIDDIQICLDSMKAPDRFQAYMSLAKFVLPTMKAVDMKVEGDMIKPIIIEINENEN